MFAVPIRAKLQGQAKVDSLIKELPKVNIDSNKVKLLNQISYYYQRIDPYKGLDYGRKGYKISEKINWEFGKANILNSMGNNYLSLSEYQEALDVFNSSLKISTEIKDTIGVCSNLLCIGVTYQYMSDYSKALSYYQQVVKKYKILKDSVGVATTYTNIGLIYQYQNNFKEALYYFRESLRVFELLGKDASISKNLNNIGNVYINISDYQAALSYLNKALLINTKINDRISMAKNLSNIGNVYTLQEKFESSVNFYEKALELNQKIENFNGVAINLLNLGDSYLRLSQLKNGKKSNENNFQRNLNKEIYLNKSIDYSLQALEISEVFKERRNQIDIYLNLYKAYKLRGEFEKALDFYDKAIVLKDTVFSQETKKMVANLEAKRENEVKNKEIELLKIEQEKQVVQTFTLIGGLVMLVLIIIIIFYQRGKSEALLLNILPQQIAKRLKGKVKIIADDFSNASTVFIDLVGFTAFAKDKPAAEVVKVLNSVFHRLDDLVTIYGLEKIKTMGDGYMAAAGVPVPTLDHAVNAIEFAMAVRNEIIKFNQESGLNLDARLGIESGPVVAGVIGKKKFIYDLWGDSVNTASRMESTGMPGQIQITENVKKELESISNNYIFIEREPIEVKGKGTMQTFFVERN